MAHKQDALGLGLLVALSLGLLAPALSHAIEGTYRPTDYQAHIRLAEKMETTGEISSPHFLYQALIILARRLIPGLTFRSSGFLVALLFYTLLAVVVYTFIRPSFVSLRAPRSAVPCAVLTSLAIMFVTPVTLLTLPSRNLYFGYVNMTVYHNPTINLLKPLALLLFMLIGKAIADQESRRSLTTTIHIGALTFLSTMAKPSYTICVLPVVAFSVVFRFVRKRQVMWPLVAVGLIGGLAVGYQYMLRFSSLIASSIQASIAFAPFAVLGRNTSLLLPKFFLSILFPLYILVVYPKAAIRDVYTRIAWLAFAVGAFYSYFLVELEPSGSISYAGNFCWSGQITLFVLFATSARLFILCRSACGAERARRGRRLRFYFGGGAFLLHVGSASLFYYVNLLGLGYQWL